ncbi:MAG: mitochondrial fission ELM1 family protein [Pseudomonadota bacterium]
MFSKIWIVTDGKAGDEIQCRGVAERLDGPVESRIVAPRAPWRWLMPYGPCDPAERPGAPTGPLAAPLPDLVIASGRKTVSSVRRMTRLQTARPFTVFLKDPRTGPGIADFIWAPAHDPIEGPNVLKTLTSPHRVSPDALARARAEDWPQIAALPKPLVAVLIGGNSRNHRFEAADIDRFLDGLGRLRDTGAGLMISTSRRTPAALKAALASYRVSPETFLWDGSGPNPYLAMLSHADAVVVTADSVNMVGEASALGRPVQLFYPSGGHARITRFLDGLADKGIVTAFEGRLETGTRPSLDSTPEIAAAIVKFYQIWCEQRRIGKGAVSAQQ